MASTPPASEALAKAIASAAAYLADQIQPNGRFIYRRHPRRTYNPRKYNLLRHAGSVYALARYERDTGNRAHRPALLRAVRYLHRVIFGPLPEAPGAQPLWSVPEVVGRQADTPLQAKLGGAGLALIALTEVEGLCPGTTPRATLRALARFICFMQKPDGTFYSKYYAGAGRDDRWVSLYYPGEAMLGLLRLYRLDGETQWLETAQRGMAALAHTREGAADVPPDHWALLATGELLALWPQTGLGLEERRRVEQHALQIVDFMSREFEQAAAAGALAGCFDTKGRVCPTATRLEGLQAIRKALPESALAARQLENTIAAGIAFLLAHQIRSGPRAGGFPRAVTSAPAADPRAAEIRIDYVQHALCALLQYRASRHPAMPRPAGAPNG